MISGIPYDDLSCQHLQLTGIFICATREFRGNIIDPCSSLLFTAVKSRLLCRGLLRRKQWKRVYESKEERWEEKKEEDRSGERGEEREEKRGVGRKGERSEEWEEREAKRGEESRREEKRGAERRRVARKGVERDEKRGEERRGERGKARVGPSSDLTV